MKNHTESGIKSSGVNLGETVQELTKRPQPSEFPKYLLKVNGERKFLSFRDAYVTYDSGSVPVEFGRYVLNEDFTVRKMTDHDRSEISKAADRYSGSK